jgi:predicted RNA-binding Zn-ribbon protein involved in translation (DUF1610 family)
MDFDRFGHNSSYEKQWTFATSVHPTSHFIQWHCDECGHGASYPSGSFAVTLEGGSQFPDFLGCGAYPLLIVSERVVSALEGAGMTCFNQYPVRAAAVRETGLRCEDAPDYVRLELTGEWMIDFAGSKATISRVCPRCGEVKIDPPIIRRFRIIDGSWNGSDLFRDHRYFPRVNFGTKNVANLAQVHHLTSCRFDQMG